jgi:transposase InsO family protein
LKNLVAKSNDLQKFIDLGIPRSTLRQWQHAGPVEYFTIPELDYSSEQILQENISLKSTLDAACAEKELVGKTIKFFGFQIQYKRIPHASAKDELMGAITKAAQIIGLQRGLKAIGLSTARYHQWLKRQVSCLLDDQDSCPKISPSKLLPMETRKICELFCDPNFYHFSITALSWFAKRTSEVVASASTWSRVIKQFGLKRNRPRIYPQRPKVGIRASAPGQILHLNQAILRLQDGTKAFVQAVIDNFSRYVLAWSVSRDYGGIRTKALFEAAISKAKSLGLDLIPDVWMDSGTENLNSDVNTLVLEGSIQRTIAQIDVEFSNSMIESLFHRLKHKHLFLIPLTNFEALIAGVNFYITENNERIPHSALKGATPLEMITGKWNQSILAQLQQLTIKAREIRIDTNRSRKCLPCLT